MVLQGHEAPCIPARIVVIVPGRRPSRWTCPHGTRLGRSSGGTPRSLGKPKVGGVSEIVGLIADAGRLVPGEVRPERSLEPTLPRAGVLVTWVELVSLPFRES